MGGALLQSSNGRDVESMLRFGCIKKNFWPKFETLSVNCRKNEVLPIMPYQVLLGVQKHFCGSLCGAGETPALCFAHCRTRHSLEAIKTESKDWGYCCEYTNIFPFSPLFKVSITFLISFWLPLFRLYYLKTTDIFPTFFPLNKLLI